MNPENGDGIRESFNATFRSESLDRWLLGNGAEAQLIIEQCRPRFSLGYLPPAALAEQVRLLLQLG